ncbi:hypothetical protein CC2G_013397 [Coprinopsis cinerea AmutBmut pab1-1]|nr:hypothetical protein CC2G_013397 [Coprinopsis cinerea AmutBmut pab1-1]
MDIPNDLASQLGIARLRRVSSRSDLPFLASFPWVSDLIPGGRPLNQAFANDPAWAVFADRVSELENLIMASESIAGRNIKRALSKDFIFSLESGQQNEDANSDSTISLITTILTSFKILDFVYFTRHQRPFLPPPISRPPVNYQSKDLDQLFSEDIKDWVVLVMNMKPHLETIVKQKRIAPNSDGEKLAINFQLALMLLRHMQDGGSKKWAGFGTIPDFTGTFQQLVTKSESENSDPKVYLDLVRPFSSRDDYRCKGLLTAILLLSPLFLIIPKLLISRNLPRRLVLQLAQALGKLKPKILLRVELLLWQSLQSLIEKKATLSAAFEALYNDIPWAELAAIPKDDPMRGFFNFREYAALIQATVWNQFCILGPAKEPTPITGASDLEEATPLPLFDTAKTMAYNETTAGPSMENMQPSPSLYAHSPLGRQQDSVGHGVKASDSLQWNLPLYLDVECPLSPVQSSQPSTSWNASNPAGTSRPPALDVDPFPWVPHRGIASQPSQTVEGDWYQSLLHGIPVALYNTVSTDNPAGYDWTQGFPSSTTATEAWREITNFDGGTSSSTQAPPNPEIHSALTSKSQRTKERKSKARKPGEVVLVRKRQAETKFVLMEPVVRSLSPRPLHWHGRGPDASHNVINAVPGSSRAVPTTRTINVGSVFSNPTSVLSKPSGREEHFLFHPSTLLQTPDEATRSLIPQALPSDSRAFHWTTREEFNSLSARDPSLIDKKIVIIKDFIRFSGGLVEKSMSVGLLSSQVFLHDQTHSTLRGPENIIPSTLASVISIMTDCRRRFITLPISRQLPAFEVSCYSSIVAAYVATASYLPADYPPRTLQFGVLASTGAIQRMSIAPDGYATVFTVSEGRVQLFRAVSRTFRPGDIRKYLEEARVEFEVSSLETGDSAHIPPGTEYMFEAEKPSILLGEYYYRLRTFQSSFFAMVDVFILAPQITLALHRDSRAVLSRLLFFVYDTLTRAANQESSQLMDQMFQLDTMDGIANLFAFVNAIVLVNVLHPDTYKSASQDLWMSHDLNGLSYDSRLEFAVFRGIALDLVNWLHCHFEIRKTVLGPDGTRSTCLSGAIVVWASWFASQASLIYWYKVRAEQAGIPGHCSSASLKYQIQSLLDLPVLCGAAGKAFSDAVSNGSLPPNLPESMVCGDYQLYHVQRRSTPLSYTPVEDFFLTGQTRADKAYFTYFSQSSCSPSESTPSEKPAAKRRMRESRPY